MMQFKRINVLDLSLFLSISLLLTKLKNKTAEIEAERLLVIDVEN